MEWLLDPAAWVGLLTLVVLEIVLGIDNLIFIAILADKLPLAARPRAHPGLSLALVMRLGLLSVMSLAGHADHAAVLHRPLAPSGRDLILMAGGFFLLFKGTMELHERLEGGGHGSSSGPRVYASFWVIVTQIVVLDAVFSLDSVITAVGMVDHLAIMMIAVIIAIGIMLLASAADPLRQRASHRGGAVPGLPADDRLSPLAESFGFKVPKGYLYAAIGFGRDRGAEPAGAAQSAQAGCRPMRERTAAAAAHAGQASARRRARPAQRQRAGHPGFGVEERNMVSGVLTLAERSIRSIMTPRTDVSWINIDDDADTIRGQLIEAPHSFFPVCRGSLDEVLGIGRAKDLIADLLTEGRVRRNRLRDPIIVHEAIGILRLMDTLKLPRGQLVLVADEFGAIEGLVTPIDVFEAIAGEFPDEDELPDIVADGERTWKIDGAADLHHVEQVLETEGLIDEAQDFSTLAGYLLSRFGHLPAGRRLRV